MKLSHFKNCDVNEGIDLIQVMDVFKTLLKNLSEKWTEIYSLHMVWFYMNYGFEYGEDNSKSIFLEDLYRIAPMFFTLSRLSIERTSRLEIVKLFEDEEKGTIRSLRMYLEDNLSILLQDADEIQELKRLNKWYQDAIHEYQNTICNLKMIRNKHLAHNDLSIFGNPADFYDEVGVKVDDVFSLIKLIKEYLDHVGFIFSVRVCTTYPDTVDITSLEVMLRKSEKN